MKFLKVVSMISLIFVASCSPSSPGSSSGSGTQIDLEKKIHSGKKLAASGDVEIYEGYIELLGQANANIAAQLKTAGGKKRLVDTLIEQELLHRESLKRGIQNKPEYQEKAALYARVILSQGLIEEIIEEKSQEYYKNNKEKEFSQIELAHILVRTPPPSKDKKDPSQELEQDKQAQAKIEAAKKKLDEGVPWDKVVEEYSDDRMTQKRGGNLGKISQDDRRADRLDWKPMIDKAFTLKAGEVAGPFKARDGYHLIKVISPAQVASYEEVKTRIEFKLRGPAKQELLNSLTQGTQIEYFEEELKTQTPSAGGAMPLSIQTKKEKTPTPGEKGQPVAPIQSGSGAETAPNAAH